MRFYFWSEGGHVIGAETRTCAEMDATVMARAYLETAPSHVRIIEAWTGARLLSRVERGVEYIDSRIVQRLAA
jgi:hypothetical protein